MSEHIGIWFLFSLSGCIVGLIIGILIGALL